MATLFEEMAANEIDKNPHNSHTRKKVNKENKKKIEEENELLDFSIKDMTTLRKPEEISRYQKTLQYRENKKRAKERTKQREKEIYEEELALLDAEWEGDMTPGEWIRQQRDLIAEMWPLKEDMAFWKRFIPYFTAKGNARPLRYWWWQLWYSWISNDYTFQYKGRLNLTPFAKTWYLYNKMFDLTAYTLDWANTYLKHHTVDIRRITDAYLWRFDFCCVYWTKGTPERTMFEDFQKDMARDVPNLPRKYWRLMLSTIFKFKELKLAVPQCMIPWKSYLIGNVLFSSVGYVLPTSTLNNPAWLVENKEQLARITSLLCWWKKSNARENLIRFPVAYCWPLSFYREFDYENASYKYATTSLDPFWRSWVVDIKEWRSADLYRKILKISEDPTVYNLSSVPEVYKNMNSRSLNKAKIPKILK